MMSLAEGVANVSIAILLLWPVRDRLRALFLAVPRPYLVFSLIFVGLLVGGQIATTDNAAYPLAEWNMHTQSVTADPEFIDYTVLRSDGIEDRLLIGRLFPIVGRKLRQRIDRMARMADSADPLVRRDATRALNGMLDLIVDAYTADHPGLAIQSIRLWTRTFPALHYTGPASITRRLMREYQPNQRG